MTCVIYIHCWKDKARVHKTTCLYYQQRGALGNVRGVWTEPIVSFKLAMKQAKQIGKADVMACNTCCGGDK